MIVLMQHITRFSWQKGGMKVNLKETWGGSVHLRYKLLGHSSVFKEVKKIKKNFKRS